MTKIMMTIDMMKMLIVLTLQQLERFIYLFIQVWAEGPGMRAQSCSREPRAEGLGKTRPL